MSFSIDRDLLAACPGLLTELPLPGLTTLDVTNATLTAGTLTLTAGSFADADIAAGSVLLVDDTPREVLAVSSATTCTTSLIRNDTSDGAISGADAAATTVIAKSFAVARGTAYHDLLQRLGIDPDRDGAQDLIDGIVSASVVRRLEVFKTLEQLYLTASGTPEQEAAWSRRAAFFRGRFAEVFFHAKVALDLDGDGQVDQERALSVLPTARA